MEASTTRDSPLSDGVTVTSSITIEQAKKYGISSRQWMRGDIRLWRPRNPLPEK